jgi:hypothetical protein
VDILTEVANSRDILQFIESLDNIPYVIGALLGTHYRGQAPLFDTPATHCLPGSCSVASRLNCLTVIATQLSPPKGLTLLTDFLILSSSFSDSGNGACPRFFHFDTLGKGMEEFGELLIKITVFAKY